MWTTSCHGQHHVNNSNFRAEKVKKTCFALSLRCPKTLTLLQDSSDDRQAYIAGMADMSGMADIMDLTDIMGIVDFRTYHGHPFMMWTTACQQL